ncbi:beta-L-arabinofuranosidase domain-containing protein [Luteibacter sp. 329MFSha]|uniref:beta-L-arabinofuranosidase domain-containing protein n=1 Tax=Luteibacter sp. 329MFSha TaxID=1798239 RepID=UPI0008BE7B73|nr:beta-L-arabinofuranosidase domain-containing protein [Luteibacter sp. 329MFSha]SEW00103.1 Beta-L-arabinofuranosidase, GH127 [Luteibacter sp. 329MFSha]
MRESHLSGRRGFLRASVIGALTPWLATAETVAPSKPPAAATFPRPPLAPQPFQLLSAGSIRPSGWLRRQLDIQAAGLGGRVDETWPDLGPRSGWLGGDGEAWERGPYFLDGLLPLAWQLDSPTLKAKAQRFIDWTLENPWPNGMFGPKSNDDWWPRMVMLKVLAQYQELTGDARVVPFMTRYFHYQLSALPDRPLRDWGRMRWQDEVAVIVWLHSRTQDPKLLELAALLKRQGYDWQAMFADFPFREKTDASVVEAKGGKNAFMEDDGLQVHGVNVAQALKASAVWSLISRNADDRSAVRHQLAQLDRYHGLANGMFSADEHLAGRSPSQGVELCAVVEAMYSLEVALAITGDATLGDRIERIAYNALPGAFTDDMWAHQYDQQPNQVECSLHKRPWTTNGPEANLFGLDPHFGCCTANFHQGWPKLTASLWMASADGGLAAALYAPCRVSTTVRGVPVDIDEDTDYPFRDDIAMTLRPASPVAFPVRLRIPAWCRSPSVRINGEAVKTAPVDGFVTVDRQWKAGDTIQLSLPAEVVAETGFNESVSFSRGPLVFSLPIGEAWVKWRKRGLTNDWQVYPTSSWNYGVLPGATMERHPIGERPFAGATPAMTLNVRGRLVAWKAEEGAADPVPAKVIAEGDPVTTLRLVPYAGAKLRITSFPALKADSPAG